MRIYIPYFDETPWDTLEKEEKDNLMRELSNEIVCYPPKKRVVLDATQGNTIYLYKGTAKIFIFNEMGVERLLFFMKEKNACACGYPNVPMILETVDECEIYYINTKKMLNALAYSQDMLEHLWDNMHRRLGLLAERLLDMGGASNKGKVCKLIYHLATVSTRTDENGGIIVEQLPNRTDIALYVGTHKANVVKCMAQLEKEQIISRVGKGLIVHDLDRLREVVLEEYYQQ